MAQRKTPAAGPNPAGLERVGPYRLGASLRRDRLGEVFAGEGPDGTAVRVRVCPGQSDSDGLVAAVDALSAIRHPGVAAVLDQFVDEAGRVAVVAPASRLTLADRRKRGKFDAAAVGPLGCVLLDGLAALHAAGLSQAAVSPAAVGIDAEGSPRWEDSALLAALTGSRMALGTRAAIDVAECAAMLRELARLPPRLEAVLDPVASGVPGAIERAAPLAEAWRAALADLGMPVPPAGVRARIPGLLPPAPASRADQPRTPRRPMPRWLPRAAAGVLITAALGVVPVAALSAPGAPLADRIDAYAPLHKGLQLTYRLTAGNLDATVVLRVTEARVIAGELTATLQSQSPLQGGEAGLPLGLGGATIRVHGDSIVRTVSGGSVRDLLLPVQPGSSWRDKRSGVQILQTIVETRTLLGPVPLEVPAGSYQRCLAVALQSTTQLIGGQGAAGTGTVWYCPGVGLARAHLVANGEPLDVVLVSAR